MLTGIGPIRPTRTSCKASPVDLERFRPNPADPNIQGNEPPIDLERFPPVSANPIIQEDEPDRSREVSAQPGRPENPGRRAPSI